MSSLESDGRVYGDAMPIVAYFNCKVTDTSVFNETATVTVNGTPAAGARYWQQSGRDRQVLEAHYRLRSDWPVRANIKVSMRV